MDSAKHCQDQSVKGNGIMSRIVRLADSNDTSADIEAISDWASLRSCWGNRMPVKRRAEAAGFSWCGKRGADIRPNFPQARMGTA